MSRYETRNNLPVETQLQLIHADLDRFETILDDRLAHLEAKIDVGFEKFDEKLEKQDSKSDKMMYVFVTGTVSLIVALVAALVTQLAVA